MTKFTIREAILTTVNTRNGVNGVDLVLNCMGLVNPWFDDKDYVFELAEMVSSGEIVELEFHNPRSNRKLISIYFPKGTKLYVNSHDEANSAHSSNAETARLSR